MGSWLPIALLRCAKIKNWAKRAGQKTTGSGGREKLTDTEEREDEREKEHTPYARPPTKVSGRGEFRKFVEEAKRL